jgi:hypothetical protein
MFKQTIGAAGVIHPSEAEAAMSFKLHPLGIVSHDEFFPHPFTDAEGEPFNAKSDFMCQYTGIWFEFKSGHMNGIKTKANADKAMARFNYAKAEGRITKRNHDIKLLEASWSDSVQKFKAVQQQTAEAGRCVVLVFDGKPDAATVKRLNTAKVFWCVYGDAHYRTFMFFRKLAKHGISSEFRIKGHEFRSHGGLNIH